MDVLNCNYFCCCIDLKIGNLLIGYIYAVFHLLNVLMAIPMAYVVGGGKLQLFVAFSKMCCDILICSVYVVLVIGVKRDIFWMIALGWIYILFSSIFSFLLCGVFLVFALKIYLAAGISMMIFCLAYGVFRIYLGLCVRSYFLKM